MINQSIGSKPFIDHYLDYYTQSFKSTWRKCNELRILNISVNSVWSEWLFYHSEMINGNRKLKESSKIELECVSINSCYRGLINVVKILLKMGTCANSKHVEMAVVKGHVEVVKILIENGTNVCTDNGWALLRAAENGHEEMVKALIEHGADVHAEGDLALQYAARKGHTGVVKVLIENDAYIHALRCAIYNGHKEVAKVLIKHGAYM